MSKIIRENDLPSAQILLVDDQADHAEVMGEALRRLGHVCTIVHSLKEAEDELAHGQFDLVVTDLVMDADEDGLLVLDKAIATQKNAETILVTAHGDVPTCKTAIKRGAYDFIEKPLDLDVFRTLCSHALRQVMLSTENLDLKEKLSPHAGFEGIIGSSESIARVIEMIKRVAPSDISVLITGESGTGKELVAQAIHRHSLRDKKQFVPLNCAGLSESILEDELFGHVRGAFTGADKPREGRFEYADGGTLFLDEVGDMPLVMQAKLLRVLESGEVIRLGANAVKHVNVRLVSATNADLNHKTSEKSFREDLYFRIKGVEIRLPALRERPEDIPLIATHYAKLYSQQIGRTPPNFSPQVISALVNFDWPGNVRQLINVVQNMVVISRGDVIEMPDVPLEIHASDHVAQYQTPQKGLSLDQMEKHAIRDALKETSGNREKAAEMLGIGERTLYRKLKEYGLK